MKDEINRVTLRFIEFDNGWNIHRIQLGSGKHGYFIDCPCETTICADFPGLGCIKSGKCSSHLVVPEHIHDTVDLLKDA